MSIVPPTNFMSISEMVKNLEQIKPRKETLDLARQVVAMEKDEMGIEEWAENLTKDICEL